MTTINELIEEAEKDPEKKALLDKARAEFEENKEDILANSNVTDITEWALQELAKQAQELDMGY